MILSALLYGLASAFGVATVEACPFCKSASQTLSEQFASMDVVVVATFVKMLPQEPPTAAASLPAAAVFEVLESLKGQGLAPPKSRIQTTCPEESQRKAGLSFLIQAAVGPDKKLMWSSPLFLSEPARRYIGKLTGLPPDGSERLAMFLDYLEDPDDLMARDAYEEFARAPYTVVKSLKGQMDHDRLVAWIRDPRVPPGRRGLYVTMLGICGRTSDIPFVEALLRGEKQSARFGLDAMIACYLTLSGPEGMPLVEELFLKNNEAEYLDTFAAVSALRFHGSEEDRVPRQRILAALHQLLERPALADIVIPDLARWEDWSAMPRLVRLFKEADKDSTWVRAPVVNYLRVCPKPEAQEYLRELEQIDPAAVKRATTLFPFGASAFGAPRGK